jgi:ectoine hydroxylase-related dioxygenase (phytanoyl-CoA dioxygenase family)
VPPEVDDTTQRSGWLKFGEPRYAVPGLGPLLHVQPAPGRLVLFPSYMWHGTEALRDDATRLSVAFDAVPEAELG